MFRILEIRTLKAPEYKDSVKNWELNPYSGEIPPKELRHLARYQSVMKVLKPNKRFQLVATEVPRDFFRLPDMRNLPDINISTIVGENGMGKSTLVDLMLRLINNTAYALREGLKDNTEYNLRFVRDIYASMKFETDNGIYEIVQNDNKLYCNLEKFGNLKKLWTFHFNHSVDQPHGENELIIGNKIRTKEALSDMAHEMLTRLFYTISINYSAYGNNVLDLQPEYTEDYELEKYENPNEVDRETRIWIHGIFHKNDSYQLPLVLMPYRSNGVINYNNEQNLARDRICRLALMEPSPLDSVFRDKQPYSIVFDVNDRFSCFPQFKCKDVSIVSTGLEREIQEIYDIESKKQSQSEDEPNDILNLVGDVGSFDTEVEYFRKGVKAFGYRIIMIWQNTLRIDLIEQARVLNKLSAGDGDRALSYLIYKTIKIPFTYSKFKQKWHYKLQSLLTECLEETQDKIEGSAPARVKHEETTDEITDAPTYLNGFIEDLLRDNTHITLKLRRTLALLIFKHYSTKVREVGLKDFNKRLNKALDNQDSVVAKITMSGCSPYVHIWTFEELMPSPSMRTEVRFKLKDGGSVTSTTLSSGERQMLAVLSAVVYHIANLCSLFQEHRVEDPDNVPGIRYPYVNIVFDEAELYFHPKYQTQLIKALLSAIGGMKITGQIKGINMIFVTHSPFLLSDLPKGNVLCLQDGEPAGDKLKRTFCANVYDILANDFFMKCFIGDFAMDKVQEIIDRINDSQESGDRVAELRKEIELIGDDFVRMNLLSRLERSRRTFL